jgi:hypothetical protein
MFREEILAMFDSHARIVAEISCDHLWLSAAAFATASWYSLTICRAVFWSARRTRRHRAPAFG